MKKKIKYSYYDVINSMHETDMGCCYVGEGIFKKDNKIILDNDGEGNARCGWLNLKVTKDKIFICGGAKLKKGERRKIWLFEKHEDVDKLTDEIAKFTGEYFGSFVVVRK